MTWLCFCSSELEAALLKELDPQLYAHLVTDNMESFAFCHRWVCLDSMYRPVFSFSAIECDLSPRIYVLYMLALLQGGYCWGSKGSLNTVTHCVCSRSSAATTWSSYLNKWNGPAIRKGWNKNAVQVSAVELKSWRV